MSRAIIGRGTMAEQPTEQELQKFKFSETFVVDFTVKAKDYKKAKSIYDKMFDKNISLGYDTWKELETKEIKGGKFHVQTKEQDIETTVINEIWGEEE